VAIPGLAELLRDGVRGSRVLVRADLNVPLEGDQIRDDTRIRRSVPTFRRLLAGGARVIAVSHLGRPRGRRDPALSLRPVAPRLAEILGRGVSFCDECVGAEAMAAVEALADGELILLENLRFHEGETQNDPDFARALSDLAEIYVNDAFGTAHRAHASTVGVPALLPRRAAGELLQDELVHLDAVRRPARPLLVFMGGAKVSDKIAVLEALVAHADVLAIGGAMAYTFLAARGEAIGDSRFEPDRIDAARGVVRAAEQHGCRLLLPRDHVVASSLEPGAEIRTVNEIPAGFLGMDIGPETAREYVAEAEKAGTIFWNGPMGMFEVEAFAAGTRAVAIGLADCPGITVVGGGDSVAAVNQLDLASRFDHVSTGGGASIEYVQGLTLPGVAALEG
jgi:phosphoglycerate kinase